MSRAGSLGKPERPEGKYIVETDAVASCSDCYQQNEGPVMYDKANKILFWVCPNGHEGFIEDFDL